MTISKDTLARDLNGPNAKGVRGVGILLSGAPYTDLTINPALRMMYNYYMVKVLVKADNPTYFSVEKSSLFDAEARYLAFTDLWNTVAPLDRKRPIVVGGGYSGCLYSVYHIGSGNYMCIHSSRPSGLDADTYVKGLRLYANSKGWTLIHEVPTANDGVSGAGLNGCVTTFLATRVDYTIAPKPIVRTVRLRQDSQGNTVRSDLFQTPTP